jgi:23S rRNA pseudouridine2605 synthase
MVAPNENLHGVKDAGERVAKVIARSGLCSRREAEGLIEDRRVSVNGALIESAALDISPSDIVLVDGKPLASREPPRLWRYHKPKGRVTTHKDPEGRPTVFEALPENLPRLISVGRLDFNTEGLLLLTNDGDLARHLELPSTGWARRYRVRAYGQVSEAQLKDLAGGLTIDRMSYGPIEASLEREQGDNVWITVSIREGKNREVRRIMEHLGLTVNRLIRISFGPFILGDLETGQIEEVKTAVLKDQLGPRLSRQLGVRREIPREQRRLAPGRAKPTYLRRKPVEVRPERADHDERPLKRRRILPMDGSEAPKVEFVAQKKPRQDRFAKRGERGETAPLRGADRQREREPRFEKTLGGERFETGRRPVAGRERERPEKRDQGAPYSKRHEAAGRERPERKAHGTVRSEGRDLAAGDAPRLRKFSSERKGGGPRRFEPAGEGAPREPRPRKTFEHRDEGPRPPRRFEAAGEGAPRGRAPRKEFEHRGERPRPPRRFEAAGDGAPRERGPREGSEHRGERPRPPRRFETAGGGAPRERRPSKEFEHRGEGPRPPRRFEAAGEGAPRSRAPRKEFEHRGERPRPPRQFEAAGEGAPRERRPSKEFEHRGEGQRPPRRFEAAAEGTPRERSPREGSEHRGERPRPPRRVTAGEGAPRERGPRKDFEHRGEGPRPPRRFEAAGEGAPRERGPREEGAGRTPRPPFRRPPEGERKPFKAREDGERSFSRSGGNRPAGKRGEAKPMRSGGKPAHGRYSGGPRKPGPRPRPDKDKP